MSWLRKLRLISRRVIASKIRKEENSGEGGDAMREKGLESLEAQLGELSDPGGQGRVEQRLIDIINIASGGVIGGANSWETEGKAPIGWLRRCLAVRHGITVSRYLWAGVQSGRGGGVHGLLAGQAQPWQPGQRARGCSACPAPARPALIPAGHYRVPQNFGMTCVSFFDFTPVLKTLDKIRES